LNIEIIALMRLIHQDLTPIMTIEKSAALKLIGYQINHKIYRLMKETQMLKEKHKKTQ
jgi:hypothetical protein